MQTFLWGTVIFIAVMSFPISVSDVLEGEEEEDHLPLLILYGNDIQQTPERHTYKKNRHKFTDKDISFYFYF